MTVRRGEVYFAVPDPTMDPPVGSEQWLPRPVIVVSGDDLNRASSVVLVVPCTSRIHHEYPTHVYLPPGEGGLDREGIALCEQVRAISVDRLTRLCGSVSPRILDLIDGGLMIAFGWYGEES